MTATRCLDRGRWKGSCVMLAYPQNRPGKRDRQAFSRMAKIVLFDRPFPLLEDRERARSMRQVRTAKTRVSLVVVVVAEMVPHRRGTH